MNDFDILIRGGIVVDGARNPRLRADLAIKDGRVAEIGQLAERSADEVVDADGCIVAPGFIDLHTHYDAQLFWDPYCTISGWHGVTSVVIGNCGFGFAPVRSEHRDGAMRSMTRVEAIPYASMQAAMPWSWETFPEFLDALDATPKGVNVQAFIPAGPLIAWVMGLDEAKSGRPPTDAELNGICGVFDEALEAGACGWSAQRTPPGSVAATQKDWDGTPMITDLMDDETALALCRVMARRNQGFVQLTLFSGDVKADQRHMEEMAAVSGRPVIHNAIQTYEDKPNIHRSAIRWLDRVRAQGLRVIGQGLTTDSGMSFTLVEWNMWDDSDAWREALMGSAAERTAKLRDLSRRAALRQQVPQGFPLTNTVVLRSESHPEFNDLKLHEVAARLGLHPVDAMLEVAVADDLRTLFWVAMGNTSEELVAELVASPWLLPGVSDGGAHTKFLTAGRYPTELLGKWVRDAAVLDLEEAHWRLSGYVASVVGFRDRGTLKPGAAADVVVYDLAALRSLPDEIAYDIPGGEWRRVQRAEGYHRVIVNGVTTFEHGKATGQTPGGLIRGTAG